MEKEFDFKRIGEGLGEMVLAFEQTTGRKVDGLRVQYPGPFAGSVGESNSFFADIRILEEAQK